MNAEFKRRLGRLKFFVLTLFCVLTRNCAVDKLVGVTRTVTTSRREVMNVYRIQPQNAELHGIETETSNGEAAGGVHVFESIAEIYGCREWCNETKVEVVTIECEKSDLRRNGDYEGALLLCGRGLIVSRKKFKDTRAVAAWAEKAGR